MKIKIRKDSNNIWSFVEMWNAKYMYSDYGVVKATSAVVVRDGKFSLEPLQYKESMFQPLANVLEHYTLPSWLASKKPIYSLLGKGIIVKFVVRYDLTTYEADFSKSHFEVYSPIVEQATEEYVPLVRVFRLSSSLEENLETLMRQLFSKGVTRANFLERRIEISESFESEKML